MRGTESQAIASERPSWVRARRSFARVAIGCMLAWLAGCDRSYFETPEIQGAAGMVDDAGKPRVWVLTKQEEQRQVGVGGGSLRNSTIWRTDTFFHFDVRAFDPVSATPLWKRRVLSIGDPEAQGVGPSRVIGSAVDAQLLGQDGALVWLLIGASPYALSAADGHVVADAEALQRINPSLRGLLPTEARFYGFDRGLVLTAADARQLVIRGPALAAAAYSAPPPAAAPEGPLKANGTRELVPSLPLGDVRVRQVTLEGRWLGLYSDKEAADAASDEWGRHLRWPYTVLDEGRLARRTFRSAKVVSVRRFDERFERLSELTPVAGSPTFLNGRFAKDAQSGNARVLAGPEGVLVWHSTRIDAAGRLALTRIDAKLATVWRAELPLSETDSMRPARTWWLPGHLVVVGELVREDAGVTQRDPSMVSVDLANGAIRSAQLAAPGPGEDAVDAAAGADEHAGR